MLKKIIHFDIKDLLIVLLLLVLCLFLFRDLLFTSSKLVSADHSDVLIYFYPYQYFTFSRLLEGKLPLWNPHLFSGYPWFANPQNQMSYPLSIIFLFLPVNMAINYSFLLHMLIAGIGMYLFIYILINHRFSALLAAFIFMFSPLFFLRCFAGHLTTLNAYAWIPLIFLMAELSLQRKRSIFAMLTGVILGIQLLAGNTQYSFYTLIGLVFYFLYPLQYI